MNITYTNNLDPRLFGFTKSTGLSPRNPTIGKVETVLRELRSGKRLDGLVDSHVRGTLDDDLQVDPYDISLMQHEIGRLVSWSRCRDKQWTDVVIENQDLIPSWITGYPISQFLLRQTTDGNRLMNQKRRVYKAGVDYMTEFSSWERSQRAGTSMFNPQFETTERFMVTPRDLATFVHSDLDSQYRNMCAWLHRFSAMRPELDAGKFVDFGMPHIHMLLSAVHMRALAWAWTQKYLQLMARPEEVFGRAALGFNSEYKKYGINLDGLEFLSQAYPEGSPSHPSFVQGHVSCAAANVTMAKILFDTNDTMSDYRPSEDGQQLIRHGTESLRVVDELDKLLWNIWVGREIAGVHWEQDATAAIPLVEMLTARAFVELTDRQAIYTPYGQCDLLALVG